MEPRDDEQQGRDLSHQERLGIGYVWLTVLGIVACLAIFFVVWLLAF